MTYIFFREGETVYSGGTAEVNLVTTEDNEIRPDTRIYSIEELKAATDNFTSSKKLGEGGYGEVYEVINHTLLI
jgi:serine/threonine protein kinase